MLASFPPWDWDGFRSEQNRQNREEETEEVNAELQKSFIRHATEVMQNTPETMRGKTQKAGNQVAPPFVKKWFIL